MSEYTLTLPKLPEKFVPIETNDRLHQWVLTALYEFKNLEEAHLIEYSTDDEQTRLVKIDKDLQADHQRLSQYLQKPITLDAKTEMKSTWERFNLNLQRLGPIEAISSYIAKHNITQCDAIAIQRPPRRLPDRPDETPKPTLPDEKQKKGRARWSQQARNSLIFLLQVVTGGRKLPARPDETPKPTPPDKTQKNRLSRLSLFVTGGRKLLAQPDETQKKDRARWSRTDRASGIYNQETGQKEPITPTPGAS